MDCIRFPTPHPVGSLVGPAQDLMIELGPFDVAWRAATHQLIVQHRAMGITCAETRAGIAFIASTLGAINVKESRGFFELRGGNGQMTSGQRIESIQKAGDSVTITGTLGSEAIPYQLALTHVSDVAVAFDVTVEQGETRHDRCRLSIAFQMETDAKAFGCGEQFTHVNLVGQRVPFISQEPGIGRGLQPLSWLLDVGFRAAGSSVHSNAPAPHVLTSEPRSLCLRQPGVSLVDLRTSGVVGFTALGAEMTGSFFAGRSPREHVEAYTAICGRMRQPPSWCDEGAIVGMQGGAEAQDRMDRVLAHHNTPISAYWLQDWVGARKTAVGSQLWWNWEADEATYPSWSERVAAFRARGVRTLVYINPFLVDTSSARQPRRDLYAEAVERGFVVLDTSGAPYPITNTDFDAALVDLTNPEAVEWLKEVIKTQLLATGVSGWMADFGEALPFDAQLHGDADPFLEHNRYPERWAALNQEAVEEAGVRDDVLYFMRSGFSNSPAHVSCFWSGDHLTAWSARDGMRSALFSLLSSGFSGFSLNHSDIGGYTTTDLLPGKLRLPGISYSRTKELLLRWIEMNAFTAFFRTHEGNKPSANHQIDSDEETLAHFARFARVYRALAGYRRTLFAEAESRGFPVVRHSWFVSPQDPLTLDTHEQFFLGDDLLIAPVFEPGTAEVNVYVPAGQWCDFWTGEARSTGGWTRLDAPLGFPAVLMRQGNTMLVEAREQLRDGGDIAT